MMTDLKMDNIIGKLMYSTTWKLMRYIKMISSTTLVYSKKNSIKSTNYNKLRLLLIYLQVQHEDEDNQPTMGENDLRIIAAEPTNSDITSAVTDDNEHVNGSQELTEEDIEEFIKSEQVAASEGNNAPISNKYTPQLSMEFKTRNDAHYFFNFYVFLAGFQVAITHTTRTQSKKKNNEVVKVTMRCNRQGKEKEPKSLEQQEADLDKDVGKKPVRRRKTNVQQKSECPCVMMVKEDGGIWKIKTLDLKHNHELCPGQRDQLFQATST